MESVIGASMSESRGDVVVEERHRERARAALKARLAAILASDARTNLEEKRIGIEALALAFAEFGAEVEREVRGPHGNWVEPCGCEGCPEKVPGCWAAGMCVMCCNDCCEHPLRAPSGETPRAQEEKL